MIKQIQQIEIGSLCDWSLFCLFCGQKSLGRPEVYPCHDKLFVATSEVGFELDLDSIHAWHRPDNSQIDVEGTGIPSPTAFRSPTPNDRPIGTRTSPLQVYIDFAIAEAATKSDVS